MKAPFTVLAIILGLGVAALPARAQQSGGLMDFLRGTLGGGEESGQSAPGTALGQDQIAAGLREALTLGTRRVVERIGQPGGYLEDPKIHIPLPPALQRVQSTLRRVGLSGLADEVEVKLNRAAEEAAPKAQEIVVEAIRNLTLEDVMGIYRGPEDAATQYFRRTADDRLQDAVRPVVERSLEEVGAITAYNSLTDHYRSLPMVPDLKADLREYATRQALDGLYHYLAREEAAIRADPAKRTTDLLRTVFGGR